MAFDLLARLAYMKLPLGPMRVLMVYCEETRSAEGITPWLSEKKLAAFTGLSTDSVKQHRAALIRLGLLVPLEKRFGKTGRRAVYRIHLPTLEVAKDEAWKRLADAGGDPDELSAMGANSSPLNGANGGGFLTIEPGNGGEIFTAMGANSSPVMVKQTHCLISQKKPPENTREAVASSVSLVALQQANRAAKGKSNGKRQTKAGTTFSEWLAALDGKDPFLDYGPLRQVADALGLDDDHLRAAFYRFREYWTERKPHERKADWPRTFVNACKRDGYGCWRDNGNGPVLTTSGQAALKLRDAERKGAHA